MRRFICNKVRSVQMIAQTLVLVTSIVSAKNNSNLSCAAFNLPETSSSSVTSPTAATQDVVGVSVENGVENDVVTYTGKVYLSPGRAATTTDRKKLITTPQKMLTYKRSNIRRWTDNKHFLSGTQYHSSLFTQPSDGIESINVDNETLMACLDTLNMDINEDVFESEDINLSESENRQSQTPQIRLTCPTLYYPIDQQY